MKTEIRELDQVIADIRALVRTPGYIYPLLLILFEDFHMNPEELHEVDNYGRLNMNEASLLLGFLVQTPIDFTAPDSFDSLLELKRKTYELLKELHSGFHKPFFARLEAMAKNPEMGSDKGDFFGQGDMLLEPIFYAGTGVYDFQYLDFLERKYRHDKEWLKENRNFDFREVSGLFKNLKNIFNEKASKVNLYVKRQTPEVKEKALKSYKGNDFENDFQVVMNMAEMHQYAELFFDEAVFKFKPGSDDFRKAAHQCFYKNLIDLFVVKKSQLLELPGGEALIKNFSIEPSASQNKSFAGIGSYNVTRSHPLIDIGDDRLLLPIPFILAEAIYEGPFYWMMNDSEYKNQCSKHRGEAGEDIVFQYLSKVFRENAYRRVLVKSKKSQTDTDIDVLCVLGSKALCVQIKSQKLTELSRKGDNTSLQKDFQRAVQDAYEQAWVARQKIMDRSSKFFDEAGNEIELSEGIDEVFMAVVTTENYPSLTHQAHVMLKLHEGSASPLALTVFDLDLVTHYLTDPYEFLYYIRQRIELINYFRGDEEMTFLGYHLSRKLWREPKADFIALTYDWAQAIDRNYYPLKAGIEVSDKGDSIKSRWKDKRFDRLCDEIKEATDDKVTDIIFHLYDLSGDARSSFIDAIELTKRKTLADGKFHNASLPPDENHEPRFGITYFSSETDSIEEVQSRLLVLCNLRKYKSRGDAWLGLGGLKNSPRMVDCLMYNNQLWKYDEFLEEKSQYLSRSAQVRTSDFKKIGRNERCPCGSGKKFKKCCMNK